MTVGERLKALRGARSLDEVAKAVGVTSQAMWNYENDKRAPRDEIKKSISDYYETSVENIFFS